MRVRVASLLTLLALLAGCGSDADVVDFGAQPPEDGPAMPADAGLDATQADPPATVPDRDARLADGGWAEAAAYIAREADDGQATLVNIFASWCGPCRAEMPMLIEASEANPDVTFLGIDHMDRRSDGEEFLDEFGVDFATIYDVDGDVAFAVGGRGMPTTVVFDRDGRLAGRVVGEVTPAALEDLLAEVR